MADPLRIISFGAGVQTTALAILNARGEVEHPARDLVFADTGGEKPETMAYMRDHFLPWAAAHGLTLHTVARPDGVTLYDYAWRRRIIPSINTRWCTDRFKVLQINRWLRQHGASAITPADVQVGISVDESHRARVSPRDRKFVAKRYPLCEMRVARSECHVIIASAGLPDPPKSGCWFCPYSSQATWKRLAGEHPELAEKSLSLEAHARERNPRDGLIGGRGFLADLLRGGTQLPMAFDAMLENDESCTSGMCFV